MFDDLRGSSDVGSDDGPTRSHGFYNAETKRFCPAARKDEEGGPQELVLYRWTVDLSQKLDTAVGFGDSFKFCLLGTGSCNVERRVDRLPRVNEGIDALFGIESSEEETAIFRARPG